jgi:LPS sulfotransferase NodH
VASTPRSGSSLLCEALTNTGVAGRPQEYFWEGYEPHWYAEWGATDYREYVRGAIGQGMTPNCVFGAKIMWAHLGDFLRKLRSVPEYDAPRTHEALELAFPNLHYIWISRREKDRQAVSLWKAEQTDIWNMPVGESREARRQPEFDFEAIDRLARQLQDHDAAWERYFQEAGVEAFTVVYEDLVGAYEETALEALDYLGVKRSAAQPFRERQLQRQADAISEEWVRRYRELRGPLPLVQSVTLGAEL